MTVLWISIGHDNLAARETLRIRYQDLRDVILETRPVYIFARDQ